MWIIRVTGSSHRTCISDRVACFSHRSSISDRGGMFQPPGYNSHRVACFSHRSYISDRVARFNHLVIFPTRLVSAFQFVRFPTILSVRPVSNLSASLSGFRPFSSSSGFQPLVQFVRFPTVLEFVWFKTFLSFCPVSDLSRVLSILATHWMTFLSPSVDMEALLDPLPMKIPSLILSRR